MLVGSSGTGEPAPMTVEWDLPPAGLRTTDSTRSPWRLTSCRHRRELATTHSDVSDLLLQRVTVGYFSVARPGARGAGAGRLGAQAARRGRRQPRPARRRTSGART